MEEPVVARLKDAYARDQIDLDELEQHLEGVLSDAPYVLPQDLWGPLTDAPGAVLRYQPLR